MIYYLMHKNIIVARLNIEKDGKLHGVQINKSAEAHVPVGGQMNSMKFYDWWQDRAVPKTRKGVSHALRELGLPDTSSLLVNNLGLSLNDCYWIKPHDASLCWEDVSLFRNNFVDTFGELTFDTTKKLDMRGKTYFKCASSQGELQKKWCIDSSGRRFLVKGNWGSSYQQSLNEIFASRIYKDLSVQLYTPYYLTDISVEDNKSGIGCMSYNFCSENVEAISAWELLQTAKLRQNESWYLKFKQICVDLCSMSEDYFDTFISLEIMVDYLITNTDRHMNNIAVLRNPDTLKYIGFAPIYDSGNSMFFRHKEVPTAGFDKIETHSFLKYEKRLLTLANKKNIIDLDRLPSKDVFYDIYLKDIPERHSRIDNMWKAFNQKKLLLSKYIRS